MFSTSVKINTDVRAGIGWQALIIKGHLNYIECLC